MATRTNGGRIILGGAIAGVVAGLAMMMYAMLVTLAMGKGFFTPGYHIASFAVGPRHMMAAMEQSWYFALGPFVLGAMIHMVTGAVFGVIFALIARALSLRGIAAVAVGVLYGLALAAFNGLVGLDVFPQQEMQNMAAMAGWGVWLSEHALYGLVLGVWPAVRPQDVGPDVRRPGGFARQRTA